MPKMHQTYMPHSASIYPHLYCLTESLDVLQSHAALLVFSDFSHFISVTKLKHCANLQQLALCHRISKLCLLHKIYYIPPSKSSLLFLPSYTYARHDNSCKLGLINCKSPLFLSSFLQSATVDQNSLPDNIVFLSDPVKFHAALGRHLLVFQACISPYFPLLICNKYCTKPSLLPYPLMHVFLAYKYSSLLCSIYVFLLSYRIPVYHSFAESLNLWRFSIYSWTSM